MVQKGINYEQACENKKNKMPSKARSKGYQRIIKSRIKYTEPKDNNLVNNLI